MREKLIRINIIITLLSLVLLMSGCHTDMWIQAKVKTFEESPVFKHEAGSRPLVPGTVIHGYTQESDIFYTGYQNGKLVTEFPIPVTRELIKRGQDRFSIFCINCHGAVGDGHGMIAQRGFALVRQPANYHTDRLRNMPIGHFFDVMTNGYGVMYNFKDRIEPRDRWAIAAYIRALQFSQHATLAEVPEEEHKKLVVKKHEGSGSKVYSK